MIQLIEYGPWISIAAVHGFALGGGLELALACDLIYASEKAKFGAPETNLGIIPGFGGTVNLIDRVGFSAAMDWILTGRIVDAKEALDRHLISQMFSSSDFFEQVQKLADQLSNKGLYSMLAAKRLVRQMRAADKQRALLLERESFATLFASGEPQEGMSAFLEKRSPSFDTSQYAKGDSMNLEFTEEQLAVRQMAKDFAEKKVAPLAAELDRDSRYPKELVEEMAGLSFMGMCVPEAYGGAGMDMLSYVLALEEISTACASTGVIMSVNNSLACEPINRWGTEEQKRNISHRWQKERCWVAML